MTMGTQLVILDRDGVINFDSPDYIKHADEWHPIPGSLEAIALLSQAGFEVYVATNQAGIARGKLTESALAGIHAKMVAAVEAKGGRIAGIEYCPHHPDENCACRKPAPGMLLAVEQVSGIALSGQPYVGDSLKDLRAAEAAGCEPMLVLTGNGVETAKLHHPVAGTYDDLMAFARDWITRRG